MKKLQEMIALRATKNEEFQNMELTEETREAFDAAELELSNLDKDIERLEKQEERNQKIAAAAVAPVVNKDDSGENFSRAFQEYVLGGTVSSEFRGAEGINIPSMLYRADPIATTTDGGIINKIVEPEISIKKSAGEQFLRDLGVRFYEGVTGNLVLPGMVETNATQTAEGGNATSADQTPTSVTLSAKRIDTVQGYNREFLAQTSVYPSLLQDLVDSIGVQMVYQFFDSLETDAIDSSIAQAGASIAYSDILGLEAALLDVMGEPKFVTTPALRAALKDLNASSAGIKFAWNDNNEMIGHPAYGVNAVNSGQVWLGDFTKSAVATFGSGDMEVIVDPYSAKEAGKIEVMAVRLVDSGTPNAPAFSWIGNASA